VAGVHLRAGGGRRQTVRARVVVGADGKFSKVAAWAGAARYDEAPALRPVYYAYYEGVTPQPVPAVEVFYRGGHIGFVLPMESGADCLALEIQPEEYAVFRADPAGRFEAALRELPGMAERLASARREGPVRGTRGVENYLRVPYGPGWALSGDAAYCKDPSTGTGIDDAFRGSFLLAEALDAVLSGAAWDETMAAFHERRDAAVSSGYRSTLAYTRMPEVPAEALAWLQAVAASPGLVRLLGSGFDAVRSAGIFPDGLLPSIDLSLPRSLAGAAAMVALVYGLVRETSS
jgi:2-polyprenyl-6-methoxyphenol hydroxylase-like FAD-dependent oxidoreductase